MKDFLVNISRWGSDSALPDELSRRIIFSNVVFITLPVVYFIFMITDYETYRQSFASLRFDQFIVPIIISLSLSCLLLNKYSLIMTSRITFLILWPVLLQYIPVYLLHSPPDYYLAFPVGMIFYSILIQLMISRRNEPFTFWILTGFSLISTILAEKVLTFFSSSVRGVASSFITDKYYTLDGILYWLLFNLVIFYVMYIIEKYIRELVVANRIIEEQKMSLDFLNQNLEQTVLARTEELNEQNVKLKEYAFFNAHLLRGPFCRVKGLLALQDLLHDSVSELPGIKSKLNESMNELDQRLNEIQDIVHTDFDENH